jgi:hypothetical protein
MTQEALKEKARLVVVPTGKLIGEARITPLRRAITHSRRRCANWRNV